MTIAFVNATSESTDLFNLETLSIAWPSGLAEGHIVVGAFAATNAALPGVFNSLLFSAGFEVHAAIDFTPFEPGGAYTRVHLATMKATGAETGDLAVTYWDPSYSFPDRGPYRLTGILSAYSGCHQTEWLDVASFGQCNTIASTNIASPSLTPSDNQPKRLISVYAAAQGNEQLAVSENLEPPGSQTERGQIIENNRYSALMLADEAYTGPAPTGGRVATMLSNKVSMGLSLLLREAPSTRLFASSIF
jgi:hypothetical protein